jgi:hypothetical protein
MSPADPTGDCRHNEPGPFPVLGRRRRHGRLTRAGSTRHPSESGSQPDPPLKPGAEAADTAGGPMCRFHMPADPAAPETADHATSSPSIASSRVQSSRSCAPAATVRRAFCRVASLNAYRCSTGLAASSPGSPAGRRAMPNVALPSSSLDRERRAVMTPSQRDALGWAAIPRSSIGRAFDC